jgi:hypothetical protein
MKSHELGFLLVPIAVQRPEERKEPLQMVSSSRDDQVVRMGVVRRMQLNRSSLAVAVLDRGLAIHQGNDGLAGHNEVVVHDGENEGCCAQRNIASADWPCGGVILPCGAGEYTYRPPVMDSTTSVAPLRFSR